jgi:hypothetical protein
MSNILIRAIIPTMTEHPASRPTRDLALFALVAAPFFINDVLFIASATTAQ